MTFAQARQIRRLYAAGKHRQRELARRFGCTVSSVSAVWHNHRHHDPDHRPGPVRRQWTRHPTRQPEYQARRREGLTLTAIGRLYGVSRQAVHATLNR